MTTRAPGNFLEHSILSPAPAVTRKEAQEFCRKLARSHYENFIVASILLPRHLTQHFFNIYAYCRISDDLGDEIGNPQESLRLLDLWEAELEACYRGEPRHPVFVALQETVEMFEIPITPFADLLKAFKQDQTKTRYKTYEELLEYCRFSANPVGHLVLYLGGYRDSERQKLSDCTCTALQLTNHWQDIASDLSRLDRIYLPQEDMDRYGYAEADLRRQICDDRFSGLMYLEVQRARELFQQGSKLSQLVERPFSLEIELFGRCGLELLKRIEEVHYDIFGRRPTLTKWERLKILLEYWRK